MPRNEPTRSEDIAFKVLCMWDGRHTAIVVYVVCGRKIYMLSSVAFADRVGSFLADIGSCLRLKELLSRPD